MGCEVNFSVSFAVQDAGLLVVEVDDGLVVFVVLEERLVGAYNLRVLAQPVTYPATQIDDAFHAVGRHEGMAEDFLGRLADAVHAASALD